MEDPHALDEAERSSTKMPSSAPPATVSSSTPLDPTATRSNNFPGNIKMEEIAVSVASNGCSSSLSSPAEASPAKPAAPSPAASEGTVNTNPATSRTASASDSLKCKGVGLASTSELPPPPPIVLPATTYGTPGLKNDFPSVLTFQGVSVTLENNSVWRQFNGCGTEMILTKSGRRMFPYCRYRLSGLDPKRKYTLVLSIVPTDQYKYRWNATKWEITGAAENQGQGLIRAFSHHYSPSPGSEWMSTLVSFYKLKLTNHPPLDLDGHVVLHSMHRYIPRLHVIPVPVGDAPSAAQPVVMGPESWTFTFPQTEFMAVTTYQNFRITQLKINHNPFAKGFREEGNNSRLIRSHTLTQPVAMADAQPSVLKPAEPSESKEEVVDLSIKAPAVPGSFSNEQGDRLVLKPIMSTSSTKDEPYVTCLRGKQSLGKLMLVVTPAASPPTSGSLLGYHKRRKRINRGWANSRGKDWKPAAASPTVYHSPSLTVAMQPELDDVEGLLFVSFTSKEALEVHVGDKPANGAPAAPSITPVTPPLWGEEEKMAADAVPETDEEKIARSEAVLLQDIKVLKHRQVIHPVLQEVGMKLSSLDPVKPIDLQYLGVLLPLPPPKLLEKSMAVDLSSGDKGSSFLSRTGKTSDITKIKGWRNKFIKKKEASPVSDGPQKNLSAFCSNMLDEYLESEAQYISERAAAFSMLSEDSVAYQLPVKSSSYVKTLDSVLKNRKAASKSPSAANRPCPLSHKPLLYSALAAPPPPLAGAETPVQAAVVQPTLQPPASAVVQPTLQPPASAPLQPPASAPLQPPASAPLQPVAQRLSAYLPTPVQRPTPPPSVGSSNAVTPKPAGLTKVHYGMAQMEFGALNQGLGKTQLTTDRLSVALAGLLTKQMLPSQVWKVTRCPKYATTGPECGQEFCTLGCVCSSLKHLNRAPVHCRRPECMFGCACFKRKITKQLAEREELIQPVYSMTNIAHVVQPHPGSHANKLWNRDTHAEDPEPLFIPKSGSLCFPLAKVLRRNSGVYQTQPIREEDKDPVYKYLESLMTCARVREFNSKPPPELSIEPKILDSYSLKPQKATPGEQPKKSPSAVLVKKAERVCERTTSGEKEAKKQIEIQSACQWVKDRQMVLEALCQRMNQNRLSQHFWVGPYRVRPIAKIFMRKPSGSVVTYRIHISKPSKVSDVDEDESDDTDEEKTPDKSIDGEAEEDDGENVESDMQIGVTPFLSGVLPAGRLKARTKPVGCQASGLIQVNGKSYNQARLLLGNMGSLHPANRLAAFITGRLHPPGGISLKVSRKSNSTNEITAPDPLHMKADPNRPAQPAAQTLSSELWKQGAIHFIQNPSSANPFTSTRRCSVGALQKSSTSSPVSLTVSQSLKTPSFLGQSGTYSFRICPPANQSTRGQKPAGVTLPGGFTLIKLPQPAADGTASENTAKAPGADEARLHREALFNLGPLATDSGENRRGLNAGAAALNLSRSASVEHGSSPELVTVTSDENDETNSLRGESSPEIASEDLSSDSSHSSDSDSCDSSDYCANGGADDEVVDIETVEEGKQGLAIAQMKALILKAKKESGESSDGLGSVGELQAQENTAACKDNLKRTNHTFLERQRRSEQRTLFDKLQTVLKSDPRAPRLRLLSLAQKEIQNLAETSKVLEEKKRRLAQMQSVYVKELSLLSGKSGIMIKTKLKNICEKQNVREKQNEWSPFFSNLLESKAALFQSSNLKSKPKPLLDPDYFRTLSRPKPTTTTAQSKLMSLLQSNLKRALTQTSGQPPISLLVPPLALEEVPAPPPQGGQHVKEEEKQENISSPAPARVPTSQTQSCVAAPPQVPAAPPQVPAAPPQVPAAPPRVPAAPPQVPAAPPRVPVATPQVPVATPQVPAAQDGASSSPPKLPIEPVQSFSLPLIRSKTGRIILPSSLKPLGHGFYTLMVMEPLPKGEEDNAKPCDLESLVKPDGSSSELSLDSGSNFILDNEKTIEASKPQRSDVMAPVAERPHKPTFMPSVGLQAVGSSQEGATAAASNTTRSSLSFNLAKDMGGGRPRNAFVGLWDKPSEVDERKTSLLAKERPNKKLTLVLTTTQTVGSPGRAQDKLAQDKLAQDKLAQDKLAQDKLAQDKLAQDKPAPVKRRRGRPPNKKKSVQLWSPPPVHVRRTPSDSIEDCSGFMNPKPKESPTSRPLTRGALGKDFPSAKKRSWIDVEKELEPEVKSEPESD